MSPADTRAALAHYESIASLEDEPAAVQQAELDLAMPAWMWPLAALVLVLSAAASALWPLGWAS